MPKRSPPSSKESTRPMTTPYRAVGPKGKTYESKQTAQQYTRKPKDGSSKSGVVWDALQAASNMPAGPKRKKALDMLIRAYGAERNVEAARRDYQEKTYFKRERERQIKTHNRDRSK